MLPLPASPFRAKFLGPYTVTQCVLELNYFIATPDRKKSEQLYHVILLKPYFSRDGTESKITAVLTVSDGAFIVLWETEDIEAPADCVLRPRLSNSATLLILDSLVIHLSSLRQREFIKIIHEFPSLFNDTPSRTHFIEHDVDVGDALPIRQRFYRGPIVKQQALEAEVQYLPENGLAKPFCSSWASPCLLARCANEANKCLLR